MLVPFKVDHIDEVHAIERESFLSPWSKNQLLSYCGDQGKGKSFIYIKEKNIIGYLMSQRVLEEIHIHNIAVTKEYRRKCIGSKMLVDLFDYSSEQGVSKLCLEVKDSNIPAIQFYMSHGFAPVGERKKYYDDGSNAILMDRTI